MSESLAGPLRSNAPGSFDDTDLGRPLPRRVMRARREAAEGLALAAAEWTPSWAVAPSTTFGSAVPLDDDELF